jgi:hypothetical protein
VPKNAGGRKLHVTRIGTVTLTPIRVLGPGNVTDKPEPVILVGPAAADAEVAKSGMARSGNTTASLAYFFHGVISISLVKHVADIDNRSFGLDLARPCSIPSLERGMSASVIETLLGAKRYREAAFSILAGCGVRSARCHAAEAVRCAVGACSITGPAAFTTIARRKRIRERRTDAAPTASAVA